MSLCALPSPLALAANLKKLAETYQSGGAPPPPAGGDDDEDVPDLVDNFEAAAK